MRNAVTHDNDPDPVELPLVGIDVHSAILYVAVHTPLARRKWTEWTTGVTRCDIEELSNRLREMRVTKAAMEATHVFGAKLVRVLQTTGIECVVVNPQHMHGVKGRKTDKADARRLAELLRAGALRGSRIPSEDESKLRTLTRARVQAVEDETRCKNQILKLLREAGISLDTIFATVFCVTGLKILHQLAAGISPDISDEALGRIQRRKRPLVRQALGWPLEREQRIVLTQKLHRLSALGTDLHELEREIDAVVASDAQLKRAVEIADSIPGIGTLGGASVLAETGWDLSAFGSAAHLASWVGACPGRTESAGKRLSGKCAKGNRYVRRLLNQFANTLRRKPADGAPGLWLHTWFKSMVRRIGWKKAVVALGHKQLRLLYRLIRGDEVYDEERHRNSGRRERDQLRYLERRARELGYSIVGYHRIEPEPAPAAQALAEV